MTGRLQRQLTAGIERVILGLERRTGASEGNDVFLTELSRPQKRFACQEGGRRGEAAVNENGV